MTADRREEEEECSATSAAVSVKEGENEGELLLLLGEGVTKNIEEGIISLTSRSRSLSLLGDDDKGDPVRGEGK